MPYRSRPPAARPRSLPILAHVTHDPRTVLLAAPRGFCAGVERAVDVVELALRAHGAPVYVRHQIVHNTHVVADLEAKGAVFVEDESEVPEGGIVVFSAHGVAPQVKENARSLGLRAIDATCPLVTKVHIEARHYAEAGYSIVLIGHEGHQEVIGTMGNAPESITLVETPEDVQALDLPDPDRVAYLSQTTLSVDEANRVIEALKRRYPNARGPKGDDICYATQNRQDAVKVLAERSDLILVVGSANSSNSKRMVEVALEHGASDARLIDDVSDIGADWLDGVDTVGLTSGASAPEVLVGEVIDHLRSLPRGAVVETLQVVDERMHFALPAELRSLPLAAS
jgi:4-hydroxy-3-methylbut-2-enyl diphosphate reductase